MKFVVQLSREEVLNILGEALRVKGFAVSMEAPFPNIQQDVNDVCVAFNAELIEPVSEKACYNSDKECPLNGSLDDMWRREDLRK